MYVNINFVLHKVDKNGLSQNRISCCYCYIQSELDLVVERLEHRDESDFFNFGVNLDPLLLWYCASAGHVSSLYLLFSSLFHLTWILAVLCRLSVTSVISD